VPFVKQGELGRIPKTDATPRSSLRSSRVGFTLNYPRGFGNNTSTPSTTPEERRKNFEDALTALDSFLALTGGPFMLGSAWTASDINIIPTLERLRYQLPISQDFVLYDAGRWPAIAGWFDAMDSLEGYYGRTSGDEISWLSTIPVFARMFQGPDGISKESEEKAVRAEERIKELMEELKSTDLSALDEVYRYEAASKILNNREAIVSDIVNSAPKSQDHIARVDDIRDNREAIEEMLEVVIFKLLMSDLTGGNEEEEGRVSDIYAAIARQGAEVMAQRVCAPRDMSAPAAKALRVALLSVC
jgi:glutathione S-transferase